MWRHRHAWQCWQRLRWISRCDTIDIIRHEQQCRWQLWEITIDTIRCSDSVGVVTADVSWRLRFIDILMTRHIDTVTLWVFTCQLRRWNDIYIQLSTTLTPISRSRFLPVVGAVGSNVGQINEVTLHRARLVLRWVTILASTLGGDHSVDRRNE